MKSKNVARLFIFVFFLCFVFLCLSHMAYAQQITWEIPKSIEENEELDLEYIKQELDRDIGKIGALLNHHKRKSEWDRIGKLLEKHRTVLKINATSKVDKHFISSKEHMAAYFEAQTQCDIQSAVTIQFVEFQGTVDGKDDVDILAIVKFKINFGNPINDGTMTFFHRRICTWF